MCKNNLKFKMYMKNSKTTLLTCYLKEQNFKVSYLQNPTILKGQMPCYMS